MAFAAGSALLLLGHTKKLLRLAGGGMIVLCGALVFVIFSSANAAAQPPAPPPALAAASQSGQQLFLAKGCVVCHIHSRAIEKSDQYSVGVGPSLSAYRHDPAYLRQFLANPPKGSEGTNSMPNLALTTAEIDALVNFINANPSQ